MRVLGATSTITCLSTRDRVRTSLKHSLKELKHRGNSRMCPHCGELIALNSYSDHIFFCNVDRIVVDTLTTMIDTDIVPTTGRGCVE